MPRYHKCGGCGMILTEPDTVCACDIDRFMRLKTDQYADFVRDGIITGAPSRVLTLRLHVAPGEKLPEVVDYLNIEALCQMCEDHKTILTWEWEYPDGEGGYEVD